MVAFNYSGKGKLPAEFFDYAMSLMPGNESYNSRRAVAAGKAGAAASNLEQRTNSEKSGSGVLSGLGLATLIAAGATKKVSQAGYSAVKTVATDAYDLVGKGVVAPIWKQAVWPLIAGLGSGFLAMYKTTSENKTERAKAKYEASRPRQPQDQQVMEESYARLLTILATHPDIAVRTMVDGLIQQYFAVLNRRNPQEAQAPVAGQAGNPNQEAEQGIYALADEDHQAVAQAPAAARQDTLVEPLQSSTNQREKTLEEKADSVREQMHRNNEAMRSLAQDYTNTPAQNEKLKREMDVKYHELDKKGRELAFELEQYQRIQAEEELAQQDLTGAVAPIPNDPRNSFMQQTEISESTPDEQEYAQRQETPKRKGFWKRWFGWVGGGSPTFGTSQNATDANSHRNEERLEESLRRIDTEFDSENPQNPNQHSQ